MIFMNIDLVNFGFLSPHITQTFEVRVGNDENESISRMSFSRDFNNMGETNMIIRYNRPTIRTIGIIIGKKEDGENIMFLNSGQFLKR